jgi:hypothetical protein
MFIRLTENLFWDVSDIGYVCFDKPDEVQIGTCNFQNVDLTANAPNQNEREALKYYFTEYLPSVGGVIDPMRIYADREKHKAVQEELKNFVEKSESKVVDFPGIEKKEEE